MTEINEIQDRIIDEVSALDGRADLYQYLIKLGREIKLPSKEFRKDENLISGCQSKLWLASEFNSGKVIYYADSDAVITRGILTLLLQVINRRKPEDIVGADLYFLEKTGLSEHLSPVRSNGLAQVLVHIRKHARGYI
ncbi:MAG: SufE family protein [Candidatus Krumholzibacteriota bacterium]|nr:SufE family protein [Candidatus Krumholzibacteriota bacterium]